VADVVDHGRNGILCDLTPESFAAALTELLSNPDRLKEMREHSAFVARRFELAPSIDAYERLFRGVIAP